jgi:lysophospholipase L1-like esterase
MRTTTSRRRLLTATGTAATAATVAGLLAASSLTTASAQPTTQPTTQPWASAWTASPQRASKSFQQNWSEEGFKNQTIRQVVRVTAPGEAVRITLSNRYGSSPLRVTGASIAVSGKDGAVLPGTSRPLSFDGHRSPSIPVGGKLLSDSAELKLRALQKVTVTLYLRERTGSATFHDQAYATSYRARGDHRNDLRGAGRGGAFTDTSKSLYYLTDIEVRGRTAPRGSVLAFGDSITDGFGSTVDADNRWPDELAEQLDAKGNPRPVLNAGIGGNLLLHDSSWFGDSAWSRFERDALSKPGVRTLVLLGGLNDIGYSEVDLPTYQPSPDITVSELIAQQSELARRAHRKGLRVVGATLLPMKGAEYYNAVSAAKIRKLNRWIRTTSAFDDVLDFNRALAAPGDPERLNPAYDSGDRKHPNDAGYAVMGRVAERSPLI